MEMLDGYTRKEDGYPLLFLSRLYELLYVLYRDYTSQALRPGGAMGRDIKRMTQVMDWVHENYQKQVSLGEAADRAGLSREYFCRMFKRYTGQTFLEYLTAERAMHLYDSLKTSDASLTLLMEQNGITNYKVFMRAFKKLYGSTPQKIRKTLSEPSEG
jgi:transcriptional regulator GlxA family with amidase domain